MELKIEQYTPASAIQFNYDELKAELLAKADMYAAIVYTEDTVKDAKADRAALNNLKKALNEERLRREREFMAPFNDFKAKINEIIAIIDKPVMAIDTQVKAFEAAEKDKKRAEIEALWESIDKPDFLQLSRFWTDKLLNKTASLDSIGNDMRVFCAKIEADLATMERMQCDSIAIEAYKECLDITKALDESERIRKMQEAAEARKKAAEEAAEARRKAEAEAEAARNAAQDAQKATESALNDADKETTTEAEKSENAAPLARWLRFEAFMTTPQAVLLRDFCKENGIELRRPQD